jgi:REP element-mobilizing transposase RayT
MQGHDYASAGAYFVTICIEGRLPLLGTVHSGGVALSPAGEMVADSWRGFEERHEGLTLDEWVVMPDHIHGIVVQDLRVPGRSLSTVLGTWKSWTTRCYREGMRDQGWSSYDGRLCNAHSTSG